MKKLAIVPIVIISFFVVYGLFYGNVIYDLMKNDTVVIVQNPTRKVEIDVPAVNPEGEGIIVTLSVEAKPGTGKTLVDIDQLLFWTDTQDSIRNAKAVAQNVTGIDMSKYDIIYSIGTDASAIEGPSAGAAMAVATIIALEDSELNTSVSMTGALDENGTIIQVGGIPEKAQAIKNNNMTLFLVPEGQKFFVEKRKEKECTNGVFGEICQMKTIEETIDVEKKVGIPIVEVSNIKEALLYFR